MGRGVATRWLMQSPAVRVGGCLAVVALAVSGLFGGLRPATVAERISAVQPRTELTVDPFTLNFTKAVATDQISETIKARTPGTHLMVVMLHAANPSDEAVYSTLLAPVSRTRSYLNRSIVVLDDRLEPETAAVYDADSTLAVSVLNPGLTYHLALVWEFSGPVPQQLPLGLAKLTLRGETISPDVLAWQDPKEYATLTIAVQDRTGRTS